MCGQLNLRQFAERLPNSACHAGVTRATPSDHELERECLDVFYGAALGQKWPLELQWDVDSELAKRRRVELDGDLRVISLQLNFGYDEGETQCAVKSVALEIETNMIGNDNAKLVQY